MGRVAPTVLLALTALLAIRSGRVEAKDEDPVPGAALLVLAEAKGKGGDLVEAGGLIAKAVAAAVKAKSLEGEERAAETLETLLDEIEPDALNGVLANPLRNTRPGRFKARELVATVHAGLDANRRGLFLSASSLALGLLLDSIAIGDDTYLTPAVATLVAAGAAPKGGVAAAHFARLAEGVRFARDGKIDEALAALAPAAQDLEGRGFTLPALHARLEQAAVLFASQREAEAFAVLGKAVDALPKEPDLPNVHEWLHAVENRLEKATPASLNAFRERSQPLLGSSPPIAGGRGGHGVAPGNVSPAGKALQRWTASKPFVTATRTAEGLHCELAFDAKGAATVALKPGQTTWEAGGVTLFLAGPAVALCMVDEVGSRTQPSGRHRASRARAYCWLARGETYAASPGGVEITGKATALTARTGR